jgi:hypothetical protein
MEVELERIYSNRIMIDEESKVAISNSDVEPNSSERNDIANSSLYNQARSENRSSRAK